MDTEFESTIAEIIRLIEKTGLDPYSQLFGYVTTGKIEYITRNGDARNKIRTLDLQKLKDHMEQMQNGKSNNS